MGTEDITRETALNAAMQFLATAFPKHYGAKADRQKPDTDPGRKP